MATGNTTRIIKRIEGSDRLGRIEDKLDRALSQQANHEKEDAAQHAGVLAMGGSLQKQIDGHLEEHKEGRKWLFALWGAAIIGAWKVAWEWVAGRR